MAKFIEKLITPILESQFPNFYAEDGTNFIAFVKAYYEWMEENGNSLYHSRRLLDYDDIDRTPDEFIIHFKNKYLNDIQFDTATNKRLIIKNSRDLYRAKGSLRGLELFFKLVYAQPLTLYYPKKDIFKASDNEWIIPTYLEVTESPLMQSYLGQEIIGVTSKATAFVDRINRRRANEKYINLLYVSNLRGNFAKDEPLQLLGNTNLIDVPYHIGSVNQLTVVGAGELFATGDVVDLLSNNGSYGQGRVTSTSNVASIVEFNLVDGGYGYTNTSKVIVSEHILSLSNIQISNTSLPHVFNKWETINQPKANIVFSTATGDFAVGDIIENWNTGVLKGTGQIMELTQTTGQTNGEMFCTIATGNLQFDSTFNKAGNAVTAVITTYTDKTSTANVIGFSANATIFGDSSLGTFFAGETISQSTGNGVLQSVAIAGANVTIALGNVHGIFVQGVRATGLHSGASINVSSWDTKIGIINTVGTFTTDAYNYINGTSNCTVTRVSTGFGATFHIGSLSNTESFWINTDFLSGNNFGGVPYLSIKLDGTNSNVAGNAYGFPQNPNLGLNDRIVDTLTILNETLGTIASITGINPGANYNDTPMVEIREDFIAGFNYYDDIMVLGSTTGSFAAGEIITQAVSAPSLVELHYNNLNGIFTFGELIYQSNGTANVGIGTVFAANSTVLDLHDVTGTFVPTLYKIKGLKSAANADVTSVTVGPTLTTKGYVRPDVSNSSVLYVKRLYFQQNFVVGGNPIIGTLSAATANIVSMQPNMDGDVMGDNAIVTANVATAVGGVKTLDVFDSGMGYLNGEVVSFRSADGMREGITQITLSKQGHSQGYFRNENGFLSANKYLYDGEFYQDFSYVIKSSLPFEKYSQMLTKVMHVSGMKMFGEVDKISVANDSATMVSSKLVQA